MRVLALNSSPRGGGQSKTELMLNHLVEGMREAGASVDVIPLRKKNVKRCIGCYTCWSKTPGQCLHKDDMTSELFPKWLDAEMVVYATPLYNYTMNATLKAFIERTLPSLLPFFETQDKRMFHPLRSKAPNIVMLSVAGMADTYHFKPLSAHMNYMLAAPGRKLVAEIYRSSSEMMTAPYFRQILDMILEATVLAGKELVNFGKITEDTLNTISQPIMDSDEFESAANIFWKTCVAEGVTPKEFVKKGLRPRPDTIESFLLITSMGFNPQGAKNLNATLQYDFSGQVVGSCHLIIADGTLHTKMGPAEKPDLVINTPFEVWMDITTGKANGGQMFMEGKYKAEGDIDLLLNMSKFFGENP